MNAAFIGAGIVTLLTLTFGPSDSATLQLIRYHVVNPVADRFKTLCPARRTNAATALGWIVSKYLGLFRPSLQDAVIGAVLGYMSLWVTYWPFKLLRGKEGLGYGDFKLNAAIGAWLLAGTARSGFIAAISGLCAGLLLMAAKRMRSEQPLPFFGPSLAAAGFIELSAQGALGRWLF